ncbi:hypothetical protein [Salipaludibacillus daqingensis]|uniref:hypothetical protein n=1 Tax=Salipaludibacillus daqingensis TaxID=3041001 RepID=UPI00247612B1|nr:hypothetical protein [Salipaludibacillus daqingensis]
MKKYFLLLLIPLLISNSCSNEENKIQDSVDIEGRYMQTASRDHSFTLFVEDSLSGKTYKNIHVLPYELPNPYEAEAYRIHLNEDTLFVDKETGEETTFTETNFPFHWPNQHVSVKVQEEFEPIKQQSGSHIVYELRLLPIYTAEKVITSPYTSDDFINVHTPVKDNHFILYIFDETFNREYLSTLYEYASHHETRNETNIDIRHGNPGYFVNFLDLDDEEPVFMLLTSEGESVRTNDWVEIDSYFKNKLGVKLPNVRDVNWRPPLSD